MLQVLSTGPNLAYFDKSKFWQKMSNSEECVFGKKHLTKIEFILVFDYI